MQTKSEMWPIFVPSKGRPDSKLLTHLLNSAYDWKVFVEPQELEEYKRQYGDHVVSIEKDSQGIVYVREFIKHYGEFYYSLFSDSRGREGGFYWMLDDDVENFYEFVNKKAVKRDISVLEEAQAYIEKHPTVAQAALDYQQFAWSSKVPYKLIGYCDVVVAIHVKRTKGIHYRSLIPGSKFFKEDRDFTLQVLANGWDTLRVERFAFSSPKNGSNKGGLYDLYQTGTDEEACSKKMVETWGPQICTFNVKPDGRPDVKINWSFFKKRA